MTSARILLSIAYVGEKDKPRALELLTGLQREFPTNTVFPPPIAHLRTAQEPQTISPPSSNDFCLVPQIEKVLPGSFIRNSPVCNRPVTLRR